VQSLKIARRKTSLTLSPAPLSLSLRSHRRSRARVSLATRTKRVDKEKSLCVGCVGGNEEASETGRGREDGNEKDDERERERERARRWLASVLLHSISRWQDCPLWKCDCLPLSSRLLVTRCGIVTRRASARARRTLFPGDAPQLFYYDSSRSRILGKKNLSAKVLTKALTERYNLSIF